MRIVAVSWRPPKAESVALKGGSYDDAILPVLDRTVENLLLLPHCMGLSVACPSKVCCGRPVAGVRHSRLLARNLDDIADSTPTTSPRLEAAGLFRVTNKKIRLFPSRLPTLSSLFPSYPRFPIWLDWTGLDMPPSSSKQVDALRSSFDLASLLPPGLKMSLLVWPTSRGTPGDLPCLLGLSWWQSLRFVLLAKPAGAASVAGCDDPRRANRPRAKAKKRCHSSRAGNP
ncbi:hypothetical protein B0T11DRAFT_335646, partial [Plectosphaerella cucumerina]